MLARNIVVELWIDLLGTDAKVRGHRVQNVKSGMDVHQREIGSLTGMSLRRKSKTPVTPTANGFLCSGHCLRRSSSKRW